MTVMHIYCFAKGQRPRWISLLSFFIRIYEKSGKWQGVGTTKMSENKQTEQTYSRIQTEPDKLEVQWFDSSVSSFHGIGAFRNKLIDFDSSNFTETNVAILFYPLDFGRVADSGLGDLFPKDVYNFADRLEEFNANDCQVVAISTDTCYTHLAFQKAPKSSGGLDNSRLLLVSDTDHSISKAFGVLKEGEGIAFNAAFLIDKAGNLKYVQINDLPIEIDIEEVFRNLSIIKNES